MKIVCLKGGLGNQMFEYCRFRDLMESGNDKVYLFYDRRRLKQHNGLRLSDCFELELPSCSWGIKLVVWGLKICRAVGVLKRLYDDEKPEAVLIDDYSQHRRFYTECSSLLLFPSVFGGTAERFRTDDKSRGLSGIGTREARRLSASFQLDFRFMRSGLFPASHCLCQKEAARCAFLFLFRRYGMGEGESLDGGCRICGTYGTDARLCGFIFDDVVPRAYHFQFHIQLLGGIFGRRWQRYENLSSSVVPRPYMDQSAYLFGRVGRAIGYKIRPWEFPFWISRGRVYYVERRR